MAAAVVVVEMVCEREVFVPIRARRSELGWPWALQSTSALKNRREKMERALREARKSKRPLVGAGSLPACLVPRGTY